MSELCYDVKMERETLESTAVTLFEECVSSIKKQEPVKPGFWIAHDNIDSPPKFFAYGDKIIQLMNSGQGKAALFALTRHWIEMCRSDAAFIHTEAWSFKGNEKADTLDGGWEKYVDTGFKWLVNNGYGTVCQIIFLIGQTPEWTTIIERKFEDMIVNGNRMIVFAEPMNVHTQETSKYRGRTKMFGPITEPEVQAIYDQIAPDAAEIFSKIVNQ